MIERMCIPLPVILVVSYVISNYNVINLETSKHEDSSHYCVSIDR